MENARPGELDSTQKKIVLVVEFDGTDFQGYQYQDNGPTVQGEIEKALLKLTGEELRIMGASRTDSGVHARGQVVCFRTHSALKPENLLKGLNHFLPPSIAVRESYQVNNGFNVQREAVSRVYRYLILNSPVRSPLRVRYVHQVVGHLDLEAMNRACQYLLGEHDLVSFVTDLAQSVIKTTIRSVLRAEVTMRGDEVAFEIEANAFLPHQVRNTVGTLIRVGLGKIDSDEFKRIMEARKPGLAGPTVPAQGLYLIQVKYPQPLGDYHE
jgi:tRNA pseudouridine38-40 synthase